MPQGRRKYRTPPGTRLGTHKDKTQTRMNERAKDKRIQSSLDEAREKQRALDARIAAEQAEAFHLDQERLARVKREVKSSSLTPTQIAAVEAAKREEDLAELRAAIEKREFWPLSDARQLIRVGYTLESTIKRTGWPKEMLEDVRVGEW